MLEEPSIILRLHCVHAKMFSIQMLLHFSQIVPRVCTLVLFIHSVKIKDYPFRVNILSTIYISVPWQYFNVNKYTIYIYPFRVNIPILSSTIITCSFSEIEDYPFRVNI